MPGHVAVAVKPVVDCFLSGFFCLFLVVVALWTFPFFCGGFSMFEVELTFAFVGLM